jgi:hypothetical protein
MAKEPIQKTHTGTEGWYVYTPNIKLAAALATAGFPLKRDEAGNVVITSVPDSTRKPQFFWFFEKTNADGEDIKQYIRWFDYPEELEAINPDHPFLSARASVINRERLFMMTRNGGETVAIRKGRNTLYLTKNASPALRQKARSL